MENDNARAHDGSEQAEQRQTAFFERAGGNVPYLLSDEYELYINGEISLERMLDILRNYHRAYADAMPCCDGPCAHS